MSLADASALLSLVDAKQEFHQQCKAVLSTLRKPVWTTWPCFTEAVYLTSRAGGWPKIRLLWRYINADVFRFYDLKPDDIARVQVLMERYRDTPMDLADATLVAAAEALGESTVFTLDSDFYVYRRYHRDPFEVIP